MTLTFIQYPTGLPETYNLCSHFAVKLHATTQMFVMVDYVREMTVKKSCKCGKCGLFEHLLFFFLFMLLIFQRYWTSISCVFKFIFCEFQARHIRKLCPKSRTKSPLISSVVAWQRKCDYSENSIDLQ